MDQILVLLFLFYIITVFMFVVNDYEIMNAFLWPIILLRRAKDIWYE